MNKIISKEHFSEKVFKLVIEAPLIAKSRKAGHFVIVRVGEKGERMPLTIAGADPVKGTITLVVQEVGLSSTRLCELNEGDYITDVVGPLGKATHIENFGTVVCAGGGVGVVRCEEADGVVAPVVRQALLLQEGVVDELVDRHEFDGGDAELLQVFDDARIGQAGVGAADVRRHVHVEVGHAAHVRLVDHRIVVRDVGVLVVAPIEVGVDDGRLHGVGGRVKVVHRRVVVRALEPV